MTLRGALNVSSAVMIVASLLMTFFSYTIKSWVEDVNAEIKNAKQLELKMEPRLTKVEAEQRLTWDNIDRRLQGIEKNIDKLIEVRR